MKGNRPRSIGFVFRLIRYELATIVVIVVRVLVIMLVVVVASDGDLRKMAVSCVQQEDREEIVCSNISLHFIIVGCFPNGTCHFYSSEQKVCSWRIVTLRMIICLVETLIV